MNIKRVFEWRDCELGEGWGLISRPDFDTARGFGVAHDTMEHFRLDGSIVDEAHAFGCMLWGRVQGDWVGWRHGRGFADIMADDAAEIIVRYGPVPYARALPLQDEELEAQVQLLQAKALGLLAEKEETYRTGYDPEERGALDLYSFCNHVRRGYRKTLRRWGRNMDFHAWADMFETINKHPLCNEEPPSQNDKLIVSINPRRCRLTVRLDRYVDPYDY